jgi:hypothetical protein
LRSSLTVVRENILALRPGHANGLARLSTDTHSPQNARLNDDLRLLSLKDAAPPEIF